MDPTQIPFWKEAYDAHAGDLLDLLTFRLCWPDDVHDRLQDAYLTAMALEPAPEDQSAARALLFSVVDIQLKNWAVSRQIVIRQSNDEHNGEILPDPPPLCPDQVQRAPQFGETVMAVCDDCDDLVFFEAVIQGWESEDLCDDTGLDEMEVRQAVYDARCELMEALAELLPAEEPCGRGDHPDWEVLVSAMIDGDCDMEEVRELHNHFKVCPPCFIFYRNARLLDFRLAELREPDPEVLPPESLWRMILLESGLRHAAKGRTRPETDPSTWPLDDRIAFLSPDERIARFIAKPLHRDLVVFRWQSATAGAVIKAEQAWSDDFFDRRLKRKGYAGTGLYVSTNPHDASPYGTAGGKDVSPALLQFIIPAGTAFVDFFDEETREQMRLHNISPHQIRHCDVPLLLRFDHHDFNRNLGWMVLNHNPGPITVSDMDPSRYSPMTLIQMEHALLHNMATFPYVPIYHRNNKPRACYRAIIQPYLLAKLHDNPHLLDEVAPPKSDFSMRNYQWKGLKHPYLSYWDGERYVDYPDPGGRRLLLEFWAQLTDAERGPIADAWIAGTTEPAEAQRRSQLLHRALEAASLRPSERDSSHTQHLDHLEPAAMMGAIGDCEQEIFGDGHSAGLLDEDFIQTLNQLKAALQPMLTHPNGVIVIGGAGTSGRLAIHTAATHPTGIVKAAMAGGLDALFTAKERVEDLPEMGVQDLAQLVPPGVPFAYLGVTCGLSAAYVAGQVDWSLKHGGVTALIGFNPLSFASKRPLEIDGVTTHFHQILTTLVEHPNGYLLNPRIGPEPITGSTRMKGGTATRLILDALLYDCDAETHLTYARDWQNSFYRDTAGMVPMIEAAAEALRHGDSILYFTGAREGLMGLLDASECPPTFGAEPGRVKALVPDDFAEILPDFDFSAFRMASFKPEQHPHAAAFLIHHEAPQSLPEAVAEAFKAGIPVNILVTPEPDLNLLQHPELAASYRDLWLKWRLNLISTCAFVLDGKVFGNRMIDLKISNIKLFDRARRIVADLGQTEEAETVLRQVMVAGTDLDPNALPETLIPTAVRAQRVIPTAVLVARFGISVDEARARLQQEPRLKAHLVDGSTHG